MRVLVVDDYPGSAEIACVLVRLLGHEAAAATTGEHALCQLTSFDPHVLVLDIGLPDLDGFEVARRVREQRGPRTFIAMMTGWDHPDYRARFLASGADIQFLKPMSRESLSNILEAARHRFAELDGEDRA